MGQEIPRTGSDGFLRRVDKNEKGKDVVGTSF